MLCDVLDGLPATVVYGVEGERLLRPLRNRNLHACCLSQGLSSGE